jgi:hypothetical protein
MDVRVAEGRLLKPRLGLVRTGALLTALVLCMGGAVFAMTQDHVPNPTRPGIPSPRTFHTNLLPIPSVASSIPAGRIPSGVTVSMRQALTIAEAWALQSLNRSASSVRPDILSATLVSRAEAEQMAGAQPNLPDYLWEVAYRGPVRMLTGNVFPYGIVFISSTTGRVEMVIGTNALPH